MKSVTIENLELLPVRFERGLTFFASCVLDGRYFLGNVAIYSLKDGSGFRCVWPKKKLRNGLEIPIFHPVDKEVNDQIQKAISARAEELFEDVLDKANDN